MPERVHDQRLRLGIDRGGGLVQDQDGLVVQDRAGDGQALLLALLAVVMAPIVEEIMFRGVLYTHLREATEVLRMERGIVICRTAHGFVCANAGVDASNTGDPNLVTLLPAVCVR